MRKEDKLRPYRVDYFIIDEMKDTDLALVKSIILRAVTSAEAIQQVDSNSDQKIVIRAFRFYKKLVHKKDIYKAVEDLFSTKEAIKVMERVEAYRAAKIVPDHAVADPAYVDNATFYKNSSGTQINPNPTPASGPDSPATVAVVADLNGMLQHDAHEQTMDTFVPSLTSGITTPQLQAAVGTKKPFTVRTSDGTLGTLDPTATNEAAATLRKAPTSWTYGFGEPVIEPDQAVGASGRPRIPHWHGCACAVCAEVEGMSLTAKIAVFSGALAAVCAILYLLLHH